MTPMAELRELARAAKEKQVHPANWDYWVKLVLMGGPAREYIAAMSPDVTLGLLDRLEALREVLLDITSYDGTFRASDAAASWRKAAAALRADDARAALRGYGAANEEARDG